MKMKRPEAPARILEVAYFHLYERSGLTCKDECLRHVICFVILTENGAEAFVSAFPKETKYETLFMPRAFPPNRWEDLPRLLV